MRGEKKKAYLHNPHPFHNPQDATHAVPLLAGRQAGPQGPDGRTYNPCYAMLGAPRGLGHQYNEMGVAVGCALPFEPLLETGVATHYITENSAIPIWSARVIDRCVRKVQGIHQKVWGTIDMQLPDPTCRGARVQVHRKVWATWLEGGQARGWGKRLGGRWGGWATWREVGALQSK